MPIRRRRYGAQAIKKCRIFGEGGAEVSKDDGKGAIAGVIASAAAAAAPIEAEQLAFLPPPTRSSMTDEEQARVDKAIRHDRRGRPPGAQNKNTREMLEFVRKLCGDPLERRFRYAMHTPETLAIELGCSKYEAFMLLDKMWADLSGFFYAKQALVDGAGNAVVPRLTMMFGGQTAQPVGPAGAARKPWDYLEAANAEPQKNQRVIDHDPQGSHGEGSHETE